MQLGLLGCDGAQLSSQVEIVVARRGVRAHAHGDAGRQQRCEPRRRIVEIAVGARAGHDAAGALREELDVAVLQVAAVHGGRALEHPEFGEVGHRRRMRGRESERGARSDLRERSGAIAQQLHLSGGLRDVNRERDAQFTRAVVRGSQQPGPARVRRVWRQATLHARPVGARAGRIAQVVELLGDLLGGYAEKLPVVDATQSRTTRRGDLGSAVRDVSDNGDSREQRLLGADDAGCFVVGDLPGLHRKHEPREPLVERGWGHDSGERGQREMCVRVYKPGGDGAAVEVLARHIGSGRGFEFGTGAGGHDPVAVDEHAAVAYGGGGHGQDPVGGDQQHALRARARRGGSADSVCAGPCNRTRRRGRPARSRCPRCVRSSRTLRRRRS